VGISKFEFFFFVFFFFFFFTPSALFVTLMDASGLRNRRRGGSGGATAMSFTPERPGSALRERLLSDASSSGGGGGTRGFYGGADEAEEEADGSVVGARAVAHRAGAAGAGLADIIGGLLAEFARHVSRAVRAIAVRTGAVEGGQGCVAKAEILCFPPFFFFFFFFFFPLQTLFAFSTPPPFPAQCDDGAGTIQEHTGLELQ
jgi:hypothetical protein